MLRNGLGQQPREAMAKPPARDDEAEREAEAAGALNQRLDNERHQCVIDTGAEPIEDLGACEGILVPLEHCEEGEHGATDRKDQVPDDQDWIFHMRTHKHAMGGSEPLVPQKHRNGAMRLRGD